MKDLFFIVTAKLKCYKISYFERAAKLKCRENILLEIISYSLLFTLSDKAMSDKNNKYFVRRKFSLSVTYSEIFWVYCFLSSVTPNAPVHNGS